MVPSKSTHADQFLGHRDPLPLSHSSGVSRGAASQRSPNRACCPGPGSTLDSDRKSTRLNSRHAHISYAVFFFKKKKKRNERVDNDTRVSPFGPSVAQVRAV